MNIKVFVNSCTTCGVNAIYIARLKNKHPDAEIINSRADKSRYEEHLHYISRAGMDGLPHPIVVEGGGEVITLLKEWK